MKRSFSLDGNDLVVSPPKPGDKASVSQNEAECGVLASVDSDGYAALMAARQGGLVVGLGRVTIAQNLVAKASDEPPGLTAMASSGSPVAPKVPAATPYKQRLAWVVVTNYVAVFHCPLLRSAPTTAAPSPTDYGYQVWVMDARSGADALTYIEGGPSPCGGAGRVAPSVGIPLEQVSVPWHMVSRNPDGYSATIDIAVMPCDGYSHQVLADQDSSQVQVVVQRPIGAECGAAHQVPVTLDAATVTSNLPAALEHAPIGAYLGPEPPGSGPAAPGYSPPPTTGPLLILTFQDNGKALTVKTGTVLAVQPAPGDFGPGATNDVTSSNPSVLGELSEGGLVAEFKAWKPGKAELSAKSGGCSTSEVSQASCSKPWAVQVTVTS